VSDDLGNYVSGNRLNLGNYMSADKLLVLGCKTILTRSIAHSWSWLSAVANRAPVPVTVVEQTVVGSNVLLPTCGPVVVLTDMTARFDWLVDYGCAQAERRNTAVDVITGLRAPRGSRHSAQIAAEQELFDALTRCRDRWPAVPVAGHVNVAKRDAELRSRLMRAEMVVIGRPYQRSLIRRCHLVAPLGMRAGPRALTVLPTQDAGHHRPGLNGV
jgi:hypothetical protein